jgi:hypothetical protein
MRFGPNSASFADLLESVALECPRFWAPRGSTPDLCNDGFLVDRRFRLQQEPPLPLEALADLPVLGLLGEPGMGKSSVLQREARDLQTATRETRDQVLRVDLTACGTDILVCQKIFQSSQFSSWKQNEGRLHLLLDGFDTCLQHVETLVALLLDRLAYVPTERLCLRIACRSSDWPADLESGLIKLWGEESVGIWELAPLRRRDVDEAAKAFGCSGDSFLAEVDRLGASQFANRPITLRFLLNAFSEGRALPPRRTDLYREGCQVLCDEWRDDLRRTQRSQHLSLGQRFALAHKLAAITVFCQATAIYTGPRHDLPLDGDVRLEDLLGGQERWGRESSDVTRQAVLEAMDTGLFRSLGPHRIGFSHQTYAEFLAAEYLVNNGLGVPEMLRLVLHPDGSGKVVPQLHETASWLAALVPDVFSVLVSKDPATLFSSDTPPMSEEDRRSVVGQVLKLFDDGGLHDIRIVNAAAARLKYDGIAKDLEPYIHDESRSEVARRAAVVIATITRQVELQEHLIRLATDVEGPPKLRVSAAKAVREIGDASAKAALKPLVTISPENDPDDELKGNALAATWPDYLTADELFAALTPPQRPNFIGTYRQFLSSDFAACVRRDDRVRALQWAETKITRSVKTEPLGLAALKIVVAGIDWFQDTHVCDSVVSLLVKITTMRIPDLPLMTKLNSHPNARVALAETAIRVCPDEWAASCLVQYGVVTESDLPSCLTQLEAGPPVELQEKLAFFIARMVSRLPSFNTEAMDRVFDAARKNSALSKALNPVLMVELESQQAEFLKAVHAAAPDDESSMPETTPDISDLLGTAEQTDTLAFPKICYRLAGPSGDSGEEELLPGWDHLQATIQSGVIRAAKSYLNDYRIKGSCPKSVISVRRAGAIGRSSDR